MINLSIAQVIAIICMCLSSWFGGIGVAMAFLGNKGNGANLIMVLATVSWFGFGFIFWKG